MMNEIQLFPLMWVVLAEIPKLTVYILQVVKKKKR